MAVSCRLRPSKEMFTFFEENITSNTRTQIARAATGTAQEIMNTSFQFFKSENRSNISIVLDLLEAIKTMLWDRERIQGSTREPGDRTYEKKVTFNFENNVIVYYRSHEMSQRRMIKWTPKRGDISRWGDTSTAKKDKCLSSFKTDRRESAEAAENMNVDQCGATSATFVSNREVVLRGRNKSARFNLDNNMIFFYSEIDKTTTKRGLVKWPAKRNNLSRWGDLFCEAHKPCLDASNTPRLPRRHVSPKKASKRVECGLECLPPSMDILSTAKAA